MNTRYEPWSVLGQLQRHLNQYFEEGGADANGSSAATADWIPPADVEEYQDRFVLKIDIPGVDPNAVDITLEQSVLTISGNRAKDRNENDSLVRERAERASGRFHRRFALPETADSNAVQAAGKNGVLQIVIPKQPRAQPKRIKVAMEN
ncbi:MAG TPA: Hsp20/alpha crystallin family protein [Steroidobacteraceae bacterium]|jgi:HSP20 family protein|nr:Hsp20/alpha crystallin family protein [Steroidobacteraceae bacterium]